MLTTTIQQTHTDKSIHQNEETRDGCNVVQTERRQLGSKDSP